MIYICILFTHSDCTEKIVCVPLWSNLRVVSSTLAIHIRLMPEFISSSRTLCMIMWDKRNNNNNNNRVGNVRRIGMRDLFFLYIVDYITIYWQTTPWFQLYNHLRLVARWTFNRVSLFNIFTCVNIWNSKKLFRKH